MKKTWLTLTISMVLVLALSIIGAKFLLPLFNNKTYSETACLTDQITDSMDVYDIAKLYRDNGATVAVTVEGKNLEDGYTYTSLGSGVCVASNGYETKSLDENIVASKGSYIVTNYHVIDMIYMDEYTNEKISIYTEDESKYNASLLWSNRNLDIAVLYCDENLDYVAMKDKIVFPQEGQEIDYEPIFTIGTPLNLSYLNRLTRGEVASNNLMTMPNAEYVLPEGSSISVLGLYNTYEDVIDITAGITNGNSGGGCFDESGALIGLTTLGLNVEDTGGNQMNGIVPIYPVIEIIDKIISNNEKATSYTIYTISSLGITGFDSHEAYYITAFQKQSSYSYYYFEDKFYSTVSYSDDFAFDGEGYYVLSKSSTTMGNIGNGHIITQCKINGETTIEIKDRNDLIYALLKIDNGDTATFSYIGTFGLNYTQTVQF